MLETVKGPSSYKIICFQPDVPGRRKLGHRYWRGPFTAAIEDAKVRLSSYNPR
jgi:hypothetical protein